MALIDKTVKVSKEADELATGLVAAVQHIKQALADGFQIGQDLPEVLKVVFTDLVPAVQGVEKLGPEATDDEEAFITAFLLAAKSLVYVFKKQTPKT